MHSLCICSFTIPIICPLISYFIRWNDKFFIILKSFGINFFNIYIYYIVYLEISTQVCRTLKIIWTSSNFWKNVLHHKKREHSISYCKVIRIKLTKILSLIIFSNCRRDWLFTSKPRPKPNFNAITWTD